MRRNLILISIGAAAQYLRLGYKQYQKQYLHFDENQSHCLNRESVPKLSLLELSLLIAAWPDFRNRQRYEIPSLSRSYKKKYHYTPDLNIFNKIESKCSYQLGERFLYPESWQDDRILWSPTSIENASIEKAIEHLKHFDNHKIQSYKYYIKAFSYVRENKKYTFSCSLSIEQALSFLNHDETSTLMLNLFLKNGDLSITEINKDEQGMSFKI